MCTAQLFGTVGRCQIELPNGQRLWQTISETLEIPMLRELARGYINLIDIAALAESD